MKVGVITLMTALLFALPAMAGPPCTGPDTDSDGTEDMCDNCSATANASQSDGDSDGYGDICDCDHNQNNLCDAPDFVTLGTWWGQAVPPAPTYVDQNNNLLVDAPDFIAFGSGWGTPPGPACGNPKGTPCP